jgi:DNA sulfur modification protein DndB
VVGVYGGEPQWAPLSISSPIQSDRFQIDEQAQIEFQRAVGFLGFSGDESLFTIDGQHRVAGIKEALKRDESLAAEEVSAIFVSHQPTSESMERTRRLFTTLNKTAVRVKQADIIALDEDNGFAIVTRQLVDDSDLFRRGNLISFTETSAVRPSDESAVTSIIHLY